MEHRPLEEYFGEGIAKPIRLVKKIGKLCLRLLSPHYPQDALEGKIPFEEIEPMAHDLFERRYHAPDGSRAVFSREQYIQHLDEINGLTDGLEASNERDNT